MRMARASLDNAAVRTGAIHCPDEDRESGRSLTARLLDQAIADSGLQPKTIASFLGIDSAFLCRIRSGEKPMPADKFLRLPPEVRHAFISRWAESEGLTVTRQEHRRVALLQAMEAISRALRMLEADTAKESAA